MLNLINKYIIIFFFLSFFSCRIIEEKFDLKYIADVEPETLDPGLATGVTEIRIINALFDGLFKIDSKDLSIKSALAEKYEVTEDNKKYIIFLRDSKWSDGRKITSADFIETYKTILDKKNYHPYSYLLFNIKNAKDYFEGKTTDFNKVGIYSDKDNEIIFELEKPVPYFLYLLSMPIYFPVRTDIIQKYGKRWLRPENIIVSGAFNLKKRRINQDIILQKNSLYWNADNVKLKNIRIIISPDINTAFNIYETNGADILTSIPGEVNKRIKNREDVHIGNYIGTYFYRINTTQYPLSNKYFRQAITYAIDRNEISKYILSKNETPAYKFLPDGIPEFKNNDIISYDPDLAKNLIMKSGLDIKDLPAITISYNTSEEHRNIAELVKNQLEKNLGIKINLQNQEWKVFSENVKLLKYDISRASWIGDYPEPSTFLEIFLSDSQNNRTGWTSNDYDSLFNQSSLLDKTQRENSYNQLEKMLIKDEAVILPVYFYSVVNLYRKNISGINPNILNLIYFNEIEVND